MTSPEEALSHTSVSFTNLISLGGDSFSRGEELLRSGKDYHLILVLLQFRWVVG